MNKTFLYLQIGAIEDILDIYTNGKDTVQNIAKKYSVTPRTIQRLMKKYGVVRTVAEGNRNASKFKSYDWLRVPPALKKQRKTIPLKVRYEILSTYKKCNICSSTTSLQIDHIDENPYNNTISNLQVLCLLCNVGKYHSLKI